MKTIIDTDDETTEHPRPLLRLIQGGLSTKAPVIGPGDEDDDDLEDDDDETDDLDDDEDDDEISVKVIRSPSPRSVGIVGTLAVLDRTRRGSPRTVHFGPGGSEYGTEIPVVKYWTNGPCIELTSDKGRWIFEVL